MGKKKELKRFEITQTITNVYIVKAANKGDAIDKFFAGHYSEVAVMGPGDAPIEVIDLDITEDEIKTLD